MQLESLVEHNLLLLLLWIGMVIVEDTELSKCRQGFVELSAPSRSLNLFNNTKE